MALSERTENDKVEVVGQYKTVQVRCATIIERDDVEINRIFHRHSLVPGTLGENDVLVDTDLSDEDVDVQSICNAVWTDEVKELWRQKLISDKTTINT